MSAGICWQGWVRRAFRHHAAAGDVTILLNISHTKPPAGHLLCGLDVSEERDAAAKARSLLDAEMTCVEQAGQLENPDASSDAENGT
ncbi:MAG: hypothetical protein ACOX0O_03695 [Candidatus Methanoculleus thermohydrogenotrophicum]